MRRHTLVAVATSAALALQLSCAAGGRPGYRAAAPTNPAALVEKAIAALGGAEAIGRLRTIAVKGAATHWEPDQSFAPGGEPRLAGHSTFTLSRDLDDGTTRIEWVRKLVYPAPREYTFTEIVTPSAGVVLGVDTTARTKQSLSSSPPRHTMSGVRLAAAQRELVRTSPRLLLVASTTPGAISRAPDQRAAGATFPTVSYRTPGGLTFLVLFDPKTGLPARIRTLDSDSVHGDSTFDLVLEDWREVGGVRIAHAQRYELNGTVIARIRYDSVQANPTLAAAAFELPADLRAAAPDPAREPVPYQWVLRRQHIGVYLDSDAIHHDPAASPGLQLVELAPGVAQTQGGTHNSLVVELAGSLVVVDAPIDAAQSRLTIDLAAEKYPGKPVRVLVLTHHHMDHTGGARAYVAEGATLVVGGGAGEYFRRALERPDVLASGTEGMHPPSPDVIEVLDRRVLGQGDRTVELIRIENPHAEGMLIAYVPSAKLGFVTDLWNPGRDKLGEKLTPGQAAVVTAVTRAGLAPERFAGGHGTVGPYAPLKALAMGSAGK